MKPGKVNGHQVDRASLIKQKWILSKANGICLKLFQRSPAPPPPPASCKTLTSGYIPGQVVCGSQQQYISTTIFLANCAHCRGIFSHKLKSEPEERVFGLPDSQNEAQPKWLRCNIIIGECNNAEITPFPVTLLGSCNN